MRIRLLLMWTLMALVGAACGGDGGDASAASVVPGGSDSVNESTQADGSGGGADSGGDVSAPPPTPADGSITIDGEEYGVAQVLRCEPLGDEPSDADLDLVIEGTEGHYVSVTVSGGDQMLNAKMDTFPQERHELRVNEFTDDGQHEFSSFAANNAEGVWYLNFSAVLGDQDGDQTLDGPPFSIDGDRISGSLPLIMDYPDEGGAEMDAAFNVAIPSNIIDC